MINNNISDIFADIDNNVNVGDSFVVDEPELCGGYVDTSESNFSIVTQNICSINHNFDDFKILLNRLQLNEDLVVLTECWLSKVTNLPLVNNYQSFRTIRPINQNDGIVIYIKDGLNIKVYEPTYTEEVNCLIVTYKNDIAFVCIYRPPCFTNIDKFLKSIDNILYELRQFQQIVLIGDINIDIKEGNDDRRSADYLNILASHGLLPSHYFPTRKENCLDHCAVKVKSPVTTVICNSTVTDHSTIIVSVGLGLSRQKSKSKLRKKIDYGAVVDDLAEINWCELLNDNDSNNATNIFLQTIKETMIKYTTIVKIPRSKRTLKPWVTPGLIRCMKNRDRLHKNLKKDSDNIILKITYQRYRNTCNRTLKKLKNAYFRSQINKHKHNLKKQWNSIKNMCHMDKDKTPNDDLLHLKYTPKQSMNHINEYFSNIGTELAGNIIKKLGDNYSDELATHCDTNFSSFVLLETDENEVMQTIASLKNSDSTGWDGIPSILFKLSSNILATPITRICNQCFEEGSFPEALKRSIVIPIYKSGDTHDISNYRPISLLPTLSKIIEKLINKRIKTFLQKNNILSKNQYGFRDNISTADAVNKLISTVVNTLDSKEKCLAIFLDLAKAFDTVSAPLLLNKLEKIGIRGTQHKLLVDYLSNRKQSVQIGENVSDEESIQFGVPQGSILGPTLFLIYINELCNLKLRNGHIITFADDTVLLFTGKNWIETNLNANEGFQIITNWLDNNLLTLNVSKTKFITFSIRNNSQPPPSTIKIQAHHCTESENCSCSELSRVTHIKYLGVHLDNNLNWEVNTRALTGRTRKLIYIFKTLRNVCDRKLLISIFYALSQSVTTYCITSWGGCPKTTLIALERAQRALLKVMCFKKFSFPTSQLYKETSILTVRQCFIKAVVLEQHKIPISDIMLNTRRQDRVYLAPSCKTKFAHRFMHFLGPYIYNKISQKIDLKSKSKYSCKKAVTEILKTFSYDDTESLISTVE